MDFKLYLTEQIKKHPSIMPQDIAKACYQAAMGAEHLLSDTTAAKRYFDAEFEATVPRRGELFECLSDDICRVDLGAWKMTGMPREWLFNMFVGTATVPRGGREILEEYLAEAETVLESAYVDFSAEEFHGFLKKYRAAGLPSIHHSEVYRQNESPAYRIVDREFLHCLPILELAKEIENTGEVKVIAIDGRAASGKTTLSGKLSRILGAEIIRMDDFFLPPSCRTPERLAEAGGNIHYERFCDEVLPKVKEKNAFSYGVFDCGIMEISGKREIVGSEWRIVEGSYSHHPRFGEYADLRVFCSVSKEEQMRRILVRNGEKWAEIFRERWIPMEEKYFEVFKIRESADILM